MNGSKRKRVSWYFEQSSEKGKQDNTKFQNLQVIESDDSQIKMPPQIQPVLKLESKPQKQVQSSEEQEANRKRKISFLPSQSFQYESQTPPKLSVIEEEHTSKYKTQNEPVQEQQSEKNMQSIKKQMNKLSAFETPGQQFKTPKVPVKEEVKYDIETTSLNMDFELNQIKQQLEITFKKCDNLNQNSEIDVKPIRDLCMENIAILRQRLLELKQTEQKYMKISDIQPILKKKEIQVYLPQKPTINNEAIRQTLVNSLQYAVKKFFYKNKTFSLQIKLRQAEVQYQFSTEQILDPQMKLQDQFKCFQMELNQNKLILFGLKVEYYRDCQIDKADLLKASLKLKFSNSKKVQKDIILATIHSMPLLLQKLDSIEEDLVYAESVFGILWTHNLEFIYILIGYRCKVEEKKLLNYSNTPLFRFQIDLKDLKLEYQFLQYYDEIIQPFIKKESKQKNMQEISFGERQHGKISDDYTEQIRGFLSTKPSICDLVTWLNTLIK